MLPKILRSDARIRALDDLTTEELNALREAIKSLDVMDIDHVHESFLPWLAWWFRAEQWDDSWSTEKKRIVVKESLALFRYRGTDWAVEQTLSLIGFKTNIIPWHKQEPTGINGTFAIHLTQMEARGFEQKDYTDIVNGVERNKRGSQHWKMTVKNRRSQGSLFLPITVRSRQRVCIRTQPQHSLNREDNS